MAQEILFVKLCQLDDRVRRLHSRIHMSETAGHSQLRQEIGLLQKECAETEHALSQTLRGSKSELVSVMAQGYEQMEQIIQNTTRRIQDMARDSLDPEAAGEEQILLAEYALDFAQQAAERALLLSMEAIDAQRISQEERRTS